MNIYQRQYYISLKQSIDSMPHDMISQLINKYNTIDETYKLKMIIFTPLKI